MELILQFVSVFVLGFIAGAIPGPILTSIFTEVLRKGFFHSLEIIFFAGLSEVIVASSILFIFFSLPIPQSVFYGISFVGALVLIWLAKQIYGIRKLEEKGKLFDFKKIFLLTIFNGPLWIVWTTICIPQAYVLGKKIVGGQILFLVVFEIGWFVSTVSLTFLFSRFRPLLIKSHVMSKVFKFFAILLAIFAIRLVITSILYFWH